MSANATILILPLKAVIEANDKMKEETGVDGVAGVQSMISTKSLVRQIRLLGLLGSAYVKEVKGKAYIIFKGNPGQRPLLQGTRYLKSNPYVASFVVGSREIAKDAAKGAKIAVIAYVAIDVFQEIMADKFSLARLLTKVTSDAIQAALGAAAGALAGVVVVTLGAPCVVAFAVTFAVGFAVGVALTRLDQRYKLTDRAVARMMAFETELAKKMRQAALGIQRYERQIEKQIFEAHLIDRFWRDADFMLQTQLAFQHGGMR